MWWFTYFHDHKPFCYFPRLRHSIPCPFYGSCFRISAVRRSYPVVFSGFSPLMILATSFSDLRVLFLCLLAYIESFRLMKSYLEILCKSLTFMNIFYNAIESHWYLNNGSFRNIYWLSLIVKTRYKYWNSS